MMVSTARALVFALMASVALPATAQLADSPPPAPTAADQLNAASAAYSDARDNDHAAARADEQAAETAEHRADREAYIAALVAHDRAVDRADARAARQQAAYADAMAAWRRQVAACKHGDDRACRAPTPRPADFY